MFLNIEEIGLHKESHSHKKRNSSFKIILDKNDPFDEKILNLVRKGDLKVSIVGIDEENEETFENYSKKSLHHRGRHTS